ncbi:MAG: DUF362 domain-containing protein [Litorilinea sp.]
MPQSKPRVGLVHGTDRRKNVLHALELVRDDVTARVRPQVMLKPNFLSGSNQLAASHVDAMRGTIDFLMSTPKPPEEILIAEAGNEKYPGEAWDSYNYHALAEEYPIPIRLVDLHQETEWVETPIVLADRTEVRVKMPKTVIDCPSVFSIAIAKTHDVCVVTLALKNLIMGTLYKPDRIKMHGFASHAERTLPAEAQALNVNLIRVARFLYPDVAVIDGTEGLQGNGPGGDDGVDFRLAAAGVDTIAADAVMAKAMGFEPMELGLLRYAHELGMGVADLAAIDVLETRIDAVQKQFKPHETTHLQLQWQSDEFRQYLPETAQ